MRLILISLICFEIITLFFDYQFLRNIYNAFIIRFIMKQKRNISPFKTDNTDLTAKFQVTFYFRGKNCCDFTVLCSMYINPR